MQARDANSMGLDVDNLRDIDEAILDYLQEGRVTPAYCRDRLLDEDAIEVTSTYCGQRLQRLEEHDHVQNLYNTGLYELVNDPRRPDTVRAGGDAGGRMSEGDLFEDEELDASTLTADDAE
jgi:hypothetical protein